MEQIFVVFLEKIKPLDNSVLPVERIQKGLDGHYIVVLKDGTSLLGSEVRYATSKEAEAKMRITPTSVGYNEFKK